MGMDDADFQRAIDENDMIALAEHLYFVQSLSSNDYRFRRHVEAKYDTDDMNKDDMRFLRIRKIQDIFKNIPHKVKITVLGDIVE